MALVNDLERFSGRSRRIDAPRPGWFVMRLVKGGPSVPCSIAYDEQTGRWTTVIDTTTTSAIDPDDAKVFRIWLYATEIEEWEFLDMIARREWRRENDPDHPSLHPHRKIDPMRLSPVQPPKSWRTV